MAERLDGVLDEILAQQAEEEKTQTEESTAPAEGADAPAEEQGKTPLPDETTQEKQESAPATPDYNAMLNNQAQQIEALKGMIQQLQGSLEQKTKATEQMSAANADTVEKVLTKPTLNFSELEMLSDEARMQRIAEYNDAMASYTQAEIMSKLDPLLRKYASDTAMAEEETAKAQLKSRFADIGDRDAGMKNILAKTPGLANLPAEQRYTLAYLATRGIEAVNAKPKEMTVDELVAKVTSNPDAMKAIEARRIAELQKAQKDVPPLNASQGQVSAPAVAPEKPKDMKEAEIYARKMLGL